MNLTCNAGRCPLTEIQNKESICFEPIAINGDLVNRKVSSVICVTFTVRERPFFFQRIPKSKQCADEGGWVCCDQMDVWISKSIGHEVQNPTDYLFCLFIFRGWVGGSTDI